MTVNVFIPHLLYLAEFQSIGRLHQATFQRLLTVETHGWHENIAFSQILAQDNPRGHVGHVHLGIHFTGCPPFNHFELTILKLHNACAVIRYVLVDAKFCGPWVVGVHRKCRGSEKPQAGDSQ